MDDDWGLLAVVRGCCSSSANTSSRITTTVPPSPAAATGTLDGRNVFSGFGSFEIKEELGMDDLLDYFPDPFGVNKASATEGLEQLCKPYLPSNFQQQQQQYEQDLLLAISPVPLSPPCSILNPQVQQQLQIQQQQHYQQLPQQQRFQYQPSANRVNASLGVRQKKRKNQPKKTVCEVTPDKLLADNWAWRKYGQKPIKGSPHPRGYYRCSSFKGCPARKQVERCRNNSDNFILTYTAEHNHAAPTHRNSLAGVSRNKSTNIKKANTDSGGGGGGGDVDGEKNGMNLSSCSYSSPSSAFSPTTTLTDETESKHQTGGVDDLGLDELFMGFEELIGPMKLTSDVVANDGMLTTHWFGSSSTTPGDDGGKI